jgi:hypothetical protein
MSLVGCDNNPLLKGKGGAISPPSMNSFQQYQLYGTADGKLFRLDTQTGHTSLVTDKGLKTLSDDRSIQLRVGQVYTLENGKAAIYEGNEKLNSDTRRIADTLVEKYTERSDTDKSRGNVLDCEGRSIPAPPPGFVLDCKTRSNGPR